MDVWCQAYNRDPKDEAEPMAQRAKEKKGIKKDLEKG